MLLCVVLSLFWCVVAGVVDVVASVPDVPGVPEIGIEVPDVPCQEYLVQRLVAGSNEISLKIMLL